MLGTLLSSFLIAIISEIADKTQLVILGLALKFKSPGRVFIGALLAHASMDGLGILVGSWLGKTVQLGTLKVVIGGSFILLGVWEFVKLWRNGNEKSVAVGKNALAVSFVTVFVSEFGDKSQVAAGLLAAKSAFPWVTFAGFVFGLAVANGVNIFFGAKIAKRLPKKAVKVVIAVLFIAFGIAALF